MDKQPNISRFVKTFNPDPSDKEVFRLLPFLHQPQIDFTDVIDESIWMIAAIIACISMWRLFRAYRKTQWLIPALGATILLFGQGVDLLDEFYIFPKVLNEYLENYSKLIGFTLFALGLLIVVHNLIRMAENDSLTGLKNRRFFLEYAGPLLDKCRREGTPLALVFIDLDLFKLINDKFGHNSGDLVLQSLAGQLKQVIRPQDILARFGGDEFVIAMPGLDLSSADRILAGLVQPLYSAAISVPFGFSFGIAAYPGDSETLDQMIGVAETRMYTQKRAKLPDNRGICR